MSGDPILAQELWDNKKNPDKDDLHTNNKKTFDLPDRVTAKRFTFKLLYGGTDYGFSVDPKFNHVSKDRNYWKKVIEKFYNKYKVIAEWHESLVRTVVRDGCLVMPTGRTYTFDRADVVRRMWFWRPKILNYPVQGLGADVVAIGRVALWKRLRKLDLGNSVLWVSTVHDSIDLDVDEITLDKHKETCYNICTVVKQSFEDVPVNFGRLFGVHFDLPVGVEIGYGPNLATLTYYKELNVPNHGN